MRQDDVVAADDRAPIFHRRLIVAEPLDCKLARLVRFHSGYRLDASAYNHDRFAVAVSRLLDLLNGLDRVDLGLVHTPSKSLCRV